MKNSNIKIKFLIFLTFYSFALFGQGVDYSKSPEKLNKQVDEWVNGKVVFIDGTSLFCELSYNPLIPEGLLKVKDGNKIVTYDVFDVEYFTFNDSRDASEHKYISLPINNRNNVFVELLLDNQYFTLLGRKTIRIFKNTQYNYTTSRIKTYYQRFIYDMETEKFHLLQKKSFLVLMEDKKVEIKQFLKEHKLNFRDTKDYILVIKEYERLREQ